jgi:hypothetical protein
MTGVTVATVAAMAGVSVQAVREACRSGSIKAGRLPSGAWLIEDASAVHYALRALTAPTAAPAERLAAGSVTLSLAPGEVGALFRALYLAVLGTRNRISQCPACRGGACREHSDRRAELAQFLALQRLLRGAS